MVEGAEAVQRQGSARRVWVVVTQGANVLLFKQVPSVQARWRALRRARRRHQGRVDGIALELSLHSILFDQQRSHRPTGGMAHSAKPEGVGGAEIVELDDVANCAPAINYLMNDKLLWITGPERIQFAALGQPALFCEELHKCFPPR